MITIRKIFGQNDGENFCEPERPLTPQEMQGVIAIWGDDENYFYFEYTDENHPKYIELINMINTSNNG